MEKFLVSPYNLKIRIFLVLTLSCLFLYLILNDEVSNFIFGDLFTPEKYPYDLISDSNRESHKTLTGLKVNGQTFLLNNKEFSILSGSIHYFRVHPDYWYDRLIKLRAAGLNTVTTYVPWNMHQMCPNCTLKFDGILNLRRFLFLARQLGLFVILRPGPYICAEWDLGGLPSWLLAHPNIKLRSIQSPQYTSAVDIYLKQLFAHIHDMQYTHPSGQGSMIAFQVENELASYYVSGTKDDKKIEALLPNFMDAKRYLSWLCKKYREYGIAEFIFTSDGTDLYDNGKTAKLIHNLNVLGGVNFQKHALKAIQVMNRVQGEKPLFVVEYWSGWFDHWGEGVHNTFPQKSFVMNVESIFLHGGSINLYMFHGGTNFGFWNGANYISSPNANNQEKYIYTPTVTSYDYDAPLSENGLYTEKYKSLRQLISNHSRHFGKYSDPIMIVQYMDLDSILSFVELPFSSEKPLFIEEVMHYYYFGENSRHTMGKDYPQSIISGMGYILYRGLIDSSFEENNFVWPMESHSNFHNINNDLDNTKNNANQITIELSGGRIADRCDFYWHRTLIHIIEMNTGAQLTTSFPKLHDENFVGYKFQYLPPLRKLFNNNNNEIPSTNKIDGDETSYYYNEHGKSVDNPINLIQNNNIIQKENSEDQVPYLALDMLVENLGRINFNYYGDDMASKTPQFLLSEQRKGFSGQVIINGKNIKRWVIYPLDFTEEWMTGIPRDQFKQFPQKANVLQVPGFFIAYLYISQNTPSDTFITMKGWKKGCVFVNNFNIGRYWIGMGPQQTLYVPAPLLKPGVNEIIVWETEHAGSTIQFSNGHFWTAKS